MKKTATRAISWVTIATIVALFSSFVQLRPDPVFRVWIEQKGQRFAIDSHDIVLKKRPFRFIVEMENMGEVYLNANTLDTAWQHAKRGEAPFQDHFGGNSMAEETFNADHRLSVANDALSCWFYDPKMDWNRFDKGAKNINGVIKGSKTITNMAYIETRSADEPTVVKAKNFERPLYLVFMALKSEKPQVIGLVKYAKVTFE
jgi:hypothetical protein